jgi:hypothetical protein
MNLGIPYNVVNFLTAGRVLTSEEQISSIVSELVD